MESGSNLGGAVVVRWEGGLPPCVSGDSRNNEKLCRDFKANGWSFPVLMADTGLHVRATSSLTA